MPKKLTAKAVGKAFNDNVHKFKSNKMQIDLLADAYKRANRRLVEYEYGNYNYSDNVINDSEKVVYHIDSVIDAMDEQSKYILDNEVKHHKSGRWYEEYCSHTTYYRIREKAYQEFLDELNK